MDKPLHGRLSKYFWKLWEEDRERESREERGERRLRNENGPSARVVLCRARVFVCCPCALISAHSLYELSRFVIVRQLIEFAIKIKKIAFRLTFKF